MRKALPYLLVQFLVTSSLWAQTSSEVEAPLHWTTTVPIERSTQNLAITNDTNEAVRFELKLNGRFPLTTDEMIHEIRTRAETTSTSEIVAAWQFVVDSTLHGLPHSPEPWIHDPVTLVNSLGLGFCDDRSSALARLWQLLGYESRIIALGGHVVPEVTFQDQWRLLDPDHEVFYTDQQGEIVSVSRLEKSGCEGLETVGSNEKQQYLWRCDPANPAGPIALYTSRENNEDQTDSHLDFSSPQDLSFRLPAKASLVFSTDPWDGLARVWVEIPKGLQGEMRIPLVPQALYGQAKIHLEGKPILGQSGTTTQLEAQALGEPIRFEAVENIRLHFLASPKLAFLDSTNTVAIQEATGPLKIGSIPKVTIPADPARRATVRFHHLDSQNGSFLKSLAQGPEATSVAELKPDYQRYLEAEGDLRPELREQLFNRFEINFAKIQTLLGMDEEQIFTLANKNYAWSILLLFQVMRHNAYDYLEALGLSETSSPP